MLFSLLPAVSGDRWLLQQLWLDLSGLGSFQLKEAVQCILKESYLLVFQLYTLWFAIFLFGVVGCEITANKHVNY